MQIQIPIQTTWHQVPVISLAIFEFNGWISWGPFNSLGLQKIRRTIQFNVLPLGLDTRDTEQNKAAWLEGIWTPAKRIYNTDGIWSRSFCLYHIGRCRKNSDGGIFFWKSLGCTIYSPPDWLHPRILTNHPDNTRPDPQSFNRMGSWPLCMRAPNKVFVGVWRL